ncbi:hypothetical protein EHW66_05915 [Erwinia psidii]|uniref:hypothetical protein n=1 Tax=Erwinia psidii TaxID=69224 RepID=UPI00226BBCB9|nr:hypothetical protein [Erwinia psidii]MCX8964561.1 hypothetical protein [Erwinia psidii]
MMTNRAATQPHRPIIRGTGNDRSVLFSTPVTGPGQTSRLQYSMQGNRFTAPDHAAGWRLTIFCSGTAPYVTSQAFSMALVVIFCMVYSDVQRVRAPAPAAGAILTQRDTHLLLFAIILSQATPLPAMNCGIFLRK